MGIQIPYDDYKVVSGKMILARFPTRREAQDFLDKNPDKPLRIEDPNPRALMTKSQIEEAENELRKWMRPYPRKWSTDF